MARRPTYYTDIEAAAPPMEPVETPGIKTIEDLERFFNLPPDAFLKTVVYQSDDRLIAAVVSGATEINEVKLTNAVQARGLRLASDEALAAAGITPGFVSPVGLHGAEIIVDEGVLPHAYIAGANRKDFHLRNVLPGRDFPRDHVADIARVSAGGACVLCGGALVEQQGIELGHTFKLGTKYSTALGARYLGPDGREEPIVMGCYGLGLDRLLSAIVEANHDDRGITWPASVAPYQIYLLGLNLDLPDVAAACDDLYQRLLAQGAEVLYDDRLETPGVKFADADLIGLPLRVTVSARSLKQNAVELTPRRTGQHVLVPRADAISRIQSHPALTPP